MNEEDFLTSLLDNVKPKKNTWRGYEVRWCELCRVDSIWCSACGGSTCNCCGCDKCQKDFADFDKLNAHPEAHMPKEEIRVINKYYRLRQLIRECLKADRTGLDWEWLYSKGKLCDLDWKTFRLTFLPYDIAEMEGRKFDF